ncbi:carbamoyltransferase family protein [Paenibacillus pabuli]|uniref:carbamoyltransferase family protein n=1 Tax=Paenibacillus pabuli TaxID=1472 RepID=UPI003CF6490B
MNIIGIAGGFDRVFENVYSEMNGTNHDSSAVLLKNGVLVSAIEEERLNRIKHSCKAPLCAIERCLSDNGMEISEVEKFAIYGRETYQNQHYINQYLFTNYSQQREHYNPRIHLAQILSEHFGHEIDKNKIVFVPHHLAHAYSAYALSGYDRSLILSIDGAGDGIAGLILSAEEGELKTLKTIEMNDSLGWFYMRVVRFLGYGNGDEYKVMGLAPYGDPAKYRKLFGKFYHLGENGEYSIRVGNMDILFELFEARKKGEPITDVHKDLAAAIQEALERILLHVVKHYQEITGHTNLSIAGGVAHNCSANGKILYEGIFKSIFIQPAAHDAGTALGAAYYTHFKEKGFSVTPRMEHAYLGSDIGDNKTIFTKLQKWTDFLDILPSEDIIADTSQLLADGNVIGWVQGRSEFGPRALGNRSILADPRPPENKNIINHMVKMREGYRPFAPSVSQEYAREYFEIPETTSVKDFPFMNFVLNVRDEKKALLGAVTHVDGTARVQTVSKESNPKYWDLINSFGAKTGVNVLLNTSFNNHAEPIIDSVEDAVVCFLTTRLDRLVIGNYLVSKKQNEPQYENLIPSLPLHVIIKSTTQYVSYDKVEKTCFIEVSDHYVKDTPISLRLYNLLDSMDGISTIRELCDKLQLGPEEREGAVKDFYRLWTDRLVLMNTKSSDN